MTAGALLSSARQDWRTPEWFLDLVRKVGPIALDPASAPDNPTGAALHLWQGHPGGVCGLAHTWARSGLAFVNPPYGAHLSGLVDPGYKILRGGVPTGVGRGWAQRIAQDRGEWLALVPTRSDAEWWHVLHEACAWGLFWRSPSYGSRIQFVDPDTNRPRGGSTLASSVFYHGPNVDRFLRVFAPHGRIFPGHRTVLDLF